MSGLSSPGLKGGKLSRLNFHKSDWNKAQEAMGRTAVFDRRPCAFDRINVESVVRRGTQGMLRTWTLRMSGQPT